MEKPGLQAGIFRDKRRMSPEMEKHKAFRGREQAVQRPRGGKAPGDN